MNILIRVDSSSSIGTGHIMRDLVLAKQFKDDNIIFASQELEGNINFRIIENLYKLEVVKSNEISEIIKLIKKHNIDKVIIDNYDIDYAYEKRLKEETNVEIFVVDDIYARHFCDILLNHNISGNENKYKNLVPSNCELRCGSKYTLIRDEFIEAKKRKENKKNVFFTFFIAIGGSDILNLNPKILDVLLGLNDIKINIVTTDANKNLSELKEYVKNKDIIDLYINCNNMGELMAKSDLAIITPSVTSNEVHYMNLPFIAIKVADNQSDMYKFLKNNNYMVLDSFDKKRLKTFVLNTLKEFR